MPLTTDQFTSGLGRDPDWEQRSALYDLQARDYRADDELRRRRAQQGYDNQIYDLAQQVEDQRRGTMSGLESRGALRSGETQRRLGEIAARDETARQRASQALIDQQAASANELQRQLTALAVEQQRAAEEAQRRQQEQDLANWYAVAAANDAARAAAARSSGGGGGGGYHPQYHPAPAPAAVPMLAAAAPAPVPVTSGVLRGQGYPSRYDSTGGMIRNRGPF